VNRIIKDYRISRKDALILTKDRSVSEYFERCAAFCDDRVRLSSWMIKDLFKLLNEAAVPIEKCPVPPKGFSTLINLISKNDITDQIGRTVLGIMFETGKDPESIINKRGLKPIQDEERLERVLNEVMAENPEAVKKIREGMTNPIDFLIGQVMKKTEGKANPKKLRKIIDKEFLK
jgi:aspartyl-tRNA(Asn)/glutamyl-tRNA(Gln) amidotransferase subunit B